MNSSQLTAMTEAALSFCVPTWRDLPPMIQESIKDGMSQHLHEAYMRAQEAEGAKR